MGILKHSLLLIFLFTSAKCCGISMPYGNITEDLDLEVESSLAVRCTLFSSPITYENSTYDVSSQNLILKFGSIVTQADILSNSTIEYSVDKATINDSGSYSCYVKIPGIEKSLLICSTTVSVGYKPLPVQNFSCISYEFTNLTCSWIRPFNPVHTDYRLWDYLRLETFKRECPESLNETSCRWTMDTRPQYYRSTDKLYFLMIGKNALGQSKQRMIEEHYKIVKPGVPHYVMFTNVTTTSLVLHWQPPKKMEYGFPPGLQYSIQYKLISSSKPNLEVKEKLIAEETSILINNLVPHSVYEFRVRCRSTAVDNDDYWSSTVTVTEETEADVPYLAPEVSESSFDVENILGNRTITLYWKAIPDEYENGDNFHYVIQYHIHHVPSRTVRSSHEIHVGNTTVYSISHLDVHSAYLFKLYAVNQMGPSYNATAIIVDKSEKLLEKPKDIIVVSYGQGKYNLSWKASNQRPYNFTVYWCKTPNPRPYKCEGPIEWMHTTKSKLMLDLPDKESNFQFAVSANDDGQSSGISWASCLVYYKGVNYKVKRVELTPKTATSLKVQWSLECEAQKIVMKEYAMQYCEFAGSCSHAYSTKSCSDWKTVNVSNVSKEDFILGSLKPFTQYLVFMRVHTLSGWSGNSNLACEKTMATAPSDPPGSVRISNIQGKTILITFEPPKIPNGIITRYLAYYNRSDGVSHHQEFRELTPINGIYTVNLVDSMAFYTNYSIEVMACVKQACSEKSSPIYALTDISVPDVMRFPRIEVIDSVVNVSWENPTFANGPLDYFQVLKESNDSSFMQVFNVSGRNFILLKHNCSENEEDKVIYYFRVRAINIRDGIHLVGPYSQATKTMLCSNDTPIGIIVGIAVGATVGAIVVLLIVYSIYCWMRNELEMIKGINIQLPKDLDCPMENPLSSYDKFKNGLQTNHDSGIPADTSYERLCAFASEDDKDLGSVMDETNKKTKRKSSGRNNSGESNMSGKCHDSISSSNTTKTHLSIDSGAEVDSPPSPDGLFSDTSSTHTTPRSYKPDLTIVQEGNSCNSKDSGLDKEGNCSFNNHNLELPSKFSYFVKKKHFPYSNVQIPDSRMPSYSKFAILTAANTPSFIPYGEQNLSVLENSLSNSEPSVAEFDAGSSSEPLVPYCKFGLARSAGNGLNSCNHAVIVNSNNIGYCKFGTVYRALNHIDSGTISTINPVFHPVPKFLHHNPQTFTAFTSHNVLPGKHLPTKENDKAYSKFGVSSPKKPPVNGYVSFRDTLTYPPAESSIPNLAYSKVGMGEPNEEKVNGVIINPAELPSLSSRTSYVPFRNAKDMNMHDSHGIVNDSLTKDTLNDSPNKDCCSLNDSSSSNESPNKERKSFITLEPEQQSAPANQNSNLPEQKDNVLNSDIDCIIINDQSPSLLDEITSDLGNKLKPTNFMISANNDSKGFLIQDESANRQPVNQLANIMDALFGTFDFSGSDNSGIEPIIINLDDLDSSHPCNNDEDSSSDFTVESRNFCKQCNNEMSECSCCGVANVSQVGVICNGHSSQLGSDYVPISCNSTC